MAHGRRGLILAVALAAITALSVNALRLYARRNALRSQQAAPADSNVSAYTIVYSERIYNSALPPDGKLTRGVYINAVRQDGSWLRWSEDRYDGINAVSSQRRIHLASGVRIETDEAQHLKSTVLLQSSPFLNRRDPTASCRVVRRDGTVDLTEQVVGQEKVMGYQTVKLRGRGISWLAPSVGCAELRHRTFFPGGAFNEQTAMDVLIGEPDPRLFRADGYTEVLPSVLFKLSPGSADARALDGAYRAHRPQLYE